MIGLVGLRVEVWPFQVPTCEDEDVDDADVDHVC